MASKCQTNNISARYGQLSIYADCVPSAFNVAGDAIEWGREILLTDVTNLAINLETEGGESECIGTGCVNIVAATKTTPSIVFNHYGAGRLNFFTAYDASNITVEYDEAGGNPVNNTFTGAFTVDDFCTAYKCSATDPDIHIMQTDVIDLYNLSQFENNGCRKIYPRDLVVLKNGVAIDINTDYRPTVFNGNTAIEFYGLLPSDVITVTFTYTKGTITTSIGQNLPQKFNDFIIRAKVNTNDLWCDSWKLKCAKITGTPAPIFANCASTDLPEASEITVTGTELITISSYR